MSNATATNTADQIQVRPFHRGAFHAFSVRDPLTGQARHFTSEDAAKCFAARLEIARSTLDLE